MCWSSFNSTTTPTMAYLNLVNATTTLQTCNTSLTTYHPCICYSYPEVLQHPHDCLLTLWMLRLSCSFTTLPQLTINPQSIISRTTLTISQLGVWVMLRTPKPSPNNHMQRGSKTTLNLDPSTCLLCVSTNSQSDVESLWTPNLEPSLCRLSLKMASLPTRMWNFPGFWT